MGCRCCNAVIEEGRNGVHIKPSADLGRPPLHVLVNAEEFRHLLKGVGCDLSNRADVPMAHSRFGNAKQLPVLGAAVDQIKNSDRACPDQAARECWFFHDHHRVEGRAIVRESVWNESVVEGITHRGMKNPVEHHESSRLVVFIFVAATGRDFHDQIHQSWCW